MRQTLTALLIALSAFVRADDPNQAKQLIQNAVAGLAYRDNMQFVVHGSQTQGRERLSFATTVARLGNRYRIDTSGVGTENIIVIADGTKIWRWNATAREYSVVGQSGNGVLGRIRAFAPGRAVLPFQLVMGDLAIWTNPAFSIDTENETEEGTQYVVSASEMNGSPSDQQGSKFTFNIWEPKDGSPITLTSVDYLQVRGKGTKKVVMSWHGAPYDMGTYSANSFVFVPPDGSRAISDLPIKD